MSTMKLHCYSEKVFFVENGTRRKKIQFAEVYLYGKDLWVFAQYPHQLALFNEINTVKSFSKDFFFIIHKPTTSLGSIDNISRMNGIHPEMKLELRVIIQKKVYKSVATESCMAFYIQVFVNIYMHIRYQISLAFDFHRSKGVQMKAEEYETWYYWFLYQN